MIYFMGQLQDLFKIIAVDLNYKFSVIILFLER